MSNFLINSVSTLWSKCTPNLNTNKRFKATVVIIFFEFITMCWVLNYKMEQGFDISLSDLAACYATFTVTGAGYAASETFRPSGYTSHGGGMLL